MKDSSREYGRLVSRSLARGILAFGAALALAQSAEGQVMAPSPDIRETSIDSSGAWVPLGQLPVDQVGAGLRGYAIPGEGAEVTSPGRDQISFFGVASNNLYSEQTADFAITQRYETHTIAFGYRRGFQVAHLPRFELGAQFQLNQRDDGFLNGFIERFEDMWASLTNHPSSKYVLRTSDATMPPLGTSILRDGTPVYREGGEGSGLGDFYVVAKAVLKEGSPSKAAVAARIAVNIAGPSEFSRGNFVGLGLSVDKKLREWVAFHGDLRATALLDRSSVWNLPLKPMSVGFSVGPEVKLARNTSLSVQFDGSSTPYQTTGTQAFDKGYGDLTLGISHRFAVGRRSLVTQFYARENMNLPLRVRANADPDLSVGLKMTIR